MVCMPEREGLAAGSYAGRLIKYSISFHVFRKKLYWARSEVERTTSNLVETYGDAHRVVRCCDNVMAHIHSHNAHTEKPSQKKKSIVFNTYV